MLILFAIQTAASENLPAASKFAFAAVKNSFFACLPTSSCIYLITVTKLRKNIETTKYFVNFFRIILSTKIPSTKLPSSGEAIASSWSNLLLGVVAK
jgi:hypothetical protein